MCCVHRFNYGDWYQHLALKPPLTTVGFGSPLSCINYGIQWFEQCKSNPAVFDMVYDAVSETCNISRLMRRLICNDRWNTNDELATYLNQVLPHGAHCIWSLPQDVFSYMKTFLSRDDLVSLHKGHSLLHVDGNVKVHYTLRDKHLYHKILQGGGTLDMVHTGLGVEEFTKRVFFDGTIMNETVSTLLHEQLRRQNIGWVPLTLKHWDKCIISNMLPYMQLDDILHLAYCCRFMYCNIFVDEYLGQCPSLKVNVFGGNNNGKWYQFNQNPHGPYLLRSATLVNVGDDDNCFSISNDNVVVYVGAQYRLPSIGDTIKIVHFTSWPDDHDTDEWSTLTFGKSCRPIPIFIVSNVLTNGYPRVHSLCTLFDKCLLRDDVLCDVISRGCKYFYFIDCQFEPVLINHYNILNTNLTPNKELYLIDVNDVRGIGQLLSVNFFGPLFGKILWKFSILEIDCLAFPRILSQLLFFNIERHVPKDITLIVEYKYPLAEERDRKSVV